MEGWRGGGVGAWYAVGVNPHPRIRKTVKWGGAVVSVLLLVVWVGSGWCSAGWWVSGTGWVGVEAGRFGIAPFIRSTLGREPGVYGPLPWHVNWGWFWVNSAQHRRADLWIPLWPAPAGSLLITVAAWRLDTIAPRRARIGFCPKCSYNRTGLAPGAVCPECGAAAIVPPPAS